MLPAIPYVGRVALRNASEDVIRGTDVRTILTASATMVDLGEPVTPTFQVLTAPDSRAGEEAYAYHAVTGADVADA